MLGVPLGWIVLTSRREYEKRWKADHPEQMKQYSRNQLDYNRRYREDHPEQAALWRKRATLKRYNLTPEQFDVMVDTRGDRCDICGEVPNETLHVDHDHLCCTGQRSCGKCVRGLLCARCNRGLGDFRDKIYLLNSAIQYLKDGNNDT